MKIDIYAHILTEKYLQAYAKNAPQILEHVEAKSKAVTDINMRLRLMDRYPDVSQILSIANPPLDCYIKPKQAAELAKTANDELAEVILKYPDKFLGAVACIPVNNVPAALDEIDRAIIQMVGFRGIQIGTRVNGEPLSQPELKPLWKKMADYDLPIWIHPVANPKLDHDGGIFSWPFETAMAMYHLVTSGVFDDHPNIKFITHHCGSMVPYFALRIKWLINAIPKKGQVIVDREAQFRKFYNDTALYGNTDGLMLGYKYFGADHIVFATDAPLGPKYGLTLETIKSIERMEIPDGDKEKIFTDNAVSLLRLPI
jgi:predicted TIM-barrel fold metal-dependent hydrolase